MTLPTDIILPLPRDYKNMDNPDKYIQDLVFELQNMYEQIANNVNGFIRNNADVDSSQWIPTISGTTGAGATTYTNQIGWVLRQGIMVDVWFDITWSATTASGNLFIDLPYIVTKSNQKPFVGVLQPSAIAYGAGHTDLVCNAIPSTYRLEIWATGSGVPTANLGVAASGQLIGHCRYIGVSDE
jgi:hypothetical protein